MPRFGDLEALVMDVVWCAPEPVTVRAVLTALQRDRSIAYTTVMTVMDNLHRKGWLLRRREGRAWRYFASAGRDEYAAALLTEALAVTDDHVGAFARFVDRMSQEDAEALRQALGSTEPPS